MDLPLSLCFAAMRADDLLLHKLLRQGMDPNELDNDGRTALHIAASNGSVDCVLLLLDYGADPNRKDSEGNVPLWDAVVGRHKSVINLLRDNGAKLSAGDVGQFACFAVEQNNLDLLKDIIKYGGDVTLLNSLGTTALHSAISEENTEIVKFLVEKGAGIDKADVHGWTPRALADYQGHEEIKALFQTMKEPINRPVSVPETQGVPYLNKYQSEPTMAVFTPEADQSTDVKEVTLGDDQGRQRGDSFHNSLFGMISAANRPNRGDNGLLPSSCAFTSPPDLGNNRVRITISCPGKGEVAGRLTFLPDSLQELLDIGAQKFGVSLTKVLTKDGALIEDIAVVRDGDHLVLAGDGEVENSES